MIIYLRSGAIMVMTIMSSQFFIIFLAPCLAPNFGGQAEPSFQNKEEKEDVSKNIACHVYLTIMIEMN